MNRYLLDTNHLSAYLDRTRVLETRVDDGMRRGDRFGICLPVLYEYRAGIRVSRRYRQNLTRLQAALNLFRLWPCDDRTATVFADMFGELRNAGTMMSQFDLLIAATPRQHSLTLLTADRDFRAVQGITTDNWL